MIITFDKEYGRVELKKNFSEKVDYIKEKEEGKRIDGYKRQPKDKANL